MDFNEEIRKLEEVSQSVAFKSKQVSDIDQMAAVQHINQCIHAAYVAMRKINQQIVVV